MSVVQRKRQRVSKQLALEVAIARVAKATAAEKSKHERALSFLLISIPALQQPLEPVPGRSSDGPVSGPNTQGHPSNGVTTALAYSDAVVDLYLRLAEQEDDVRRFFERKDHLTCIANISYTEDQRVREFVEGSGRGEACTFSQFRTLLATLSLAADYESWAAPQRAMGHRKQAQVTAYVHAHKVLFPDETTAARAVYLGRRYQEQNRRFSGTAAVMAFAPREYDRAGSLETLTQCFESEAFRFITDLGRRLAPKLEEAQVVYAQKLVPNISKRSSECGGSASVAFQVRLDSTNAARICDVRQDFAMLTRPEQTITTESSSAPALEHPHTLMQRSCAVGASYDAPPAQVGSLSAVQPNVHWGTHNAGITHDEDWLQHDASLNINSVFTGYSTGGSNWS